MKVFCFGNEFVKEDSLAREIADELKIDGVEFIKCESTPEFIRQNGKIILDVVQMLKEPRIISVDELAEPKTVCSLHDFDLGYELKLLKEIGELGEIKIIGIPMQGDKEKIKKEIKNLLLGINNPRC